MNMSRLVPYLGIAAALLVGVFVVALSGDAVVTPSANVPLPGIESTTSVAAVASSVPKKIASTSPASSGNVSLTNSASALRNALVNILCYAPPGSKLRSVLGSGVFIDPKGIILTNAHVAQYFLLAGRGAVCTIRSGSPATDRYTAALIYISPAWLKANQGILTQADPTGTGEYDFALLAVIKSATTTMPLPASFPYLPLAKNPPQVGTPVAVASYGAQFLESNQILSSLFPTIVLSSVKDVFTFGVDTIDVLALGGSAAAQEGSSGGGVANASGRLAGIVTTSTIQGDTSTRSLDAITASYIRAEFARETGGPLELLLAEPTSTAVYEFARQASVLESILTAQLP